MHTHVHEDVDVQIHIYIHMYIHTYTTHLDVVGIVELLQHVGIRSCMHTSCHTHEWGNGFVMDESCHTHAYTHAYTLKLLQHAGSRTCTHGSCHTYECIMSNKCIRRWCCDATVMAHTSMSHDTHMNEATMVLWCMSHVIHMNEPCHTHELGDGVVMHESCHTHEWARSHSCEAMVLWCTSTAATHCNTLQHTSKHWNTPPHTAMHCIPLQHTWSACLSFTLPHAATHYNKATHSPLQHTATHCRTLQRTTTKQHTLHRVICLVMHEFGNLVCVAVCVAVRCVLQYVLQCATHSPSCDLSCDARVHNHIYAYTSVDEPYMSHESCHIKRYRLFHESCHMKRDAKILTCSCEMNHDSSTAHVTWHMTPLRLESWVMSHEKRCQNPDLFKWRDPCLIYGSSDMNHDSFTAHVTWTMTHLRLTWHDPRLLVLVSWSHGSCHEVMGHVTCAVDDSWVIF